MASDAEIRLYCFLFVLYAGAVLSWAFRLRSDDSVSRSSGNHFECALVVLLTCNSMDDNGIVMQVFTFRNQFNEWDTESTYCTLVCMCLRWLLGFGMLTYLLEYYMYRMRKEVDTVNQYSQELSRARDQIQLFSYVVLLSTATVMFAYSNLNVDYVHVDTDVNIGRANVAKVHMIPMLQRKVIDVSVGEGTLREFIKQYAMIHVASFTEDSEHMMQCTRFYGYCEFTVSHVVLVALVFMVYVGHLCWYTVSLWDGMGGKLARRAGLVLGVHILYWMVTFVLVMLYADFFETGKNVKVLLDTWFVVAMLVALYRFRNTVIERVSLYNREELLE